MRQTGVIVLAGSLLLAGGPAWGDATIESTVKTGGFKGMGASESTVVKRYQGEKMWVSTSTRFTGAIMSRIAGGGESISVTRVDKGVYWNLDPKNKTYTERAIEPFTKGEAGERTEKGKEKPGVRVTRSEFTVKKTGATETLNGFPCEEYLVRWVLEMEDLETKAKTGSTMTTNLWTTPETAAIRQAKADERKFSEAYARKLGISISPEEASHLGMEALGAMSGAPAEEIEKGLKRVKEEMSKVEGYPIRSVVSWTLEGDPAASAAKEGEGSSGSASDPIKSIGGLLSGLAGKIGQKMGGEKPSAAGGKEGPFFSSTTEVKSVRSDGISPGVFEIPGDYVKK